MKTILTIESGKKVKIKLARKVARAVLFDDKNQVAMLYVSKENYYKLPGGGIDKGETIVQALKRECLEETGCKIKNIKELGQIDEFRYFYAFKQISYCFLAQVSGPKGKPFFTDDEMAAGFKLKWMNLNKAIKLMENATISSPTGKVINKRDLTFLKVVVGK